MDKHIFNEAHDVPIPLSLGIEPRDLQILKVSPVKINFLFAQSIRTRVARKENSQPLARLMIVCTFSVSSFPLNRFTFYDKVVANRTSGYNRES